VDFSAFPPWPVRPCVLGTSGILEVDASGSGLSRLSLLAIIAKAFLCLLFKWPFKLDVGKSSGKSMLTNYDDSLLMSAGSSG